MKAAVYAGTKNLYDAMVPAVKSLIMHSDVEKIFLLIEDDKFPYPMPDIVECINVSGQRFFKPNGPNMTSKFTYMAMIRAALCKIFPDLDRILSLDVDTIVIDDISEIWDLNLGKAPNAYYFAACREPGQSKDGFLYCNIGVTLYNLEFLRNSKAQEVIDILNDRKFPYVEQDVFSRRCQGRILRIPSDYNVCGFTDPTDNPKIIHFAGKKDWRNESVYKQFNDISWNEVMKSRNRKDETGTIDERDYYLGSNWKAETSHSKQAQ